VDFLQAEQEEKELKKQYETTEKETLDVLRQINRKTEILTTLKVRHSRIYPFINESLNFSYGLRVFFLMNQITQYWDAYNQFFKEGIEFINSLQPKMEKYKQNIAVLVCVQPLTRCIFSFI
jgi:hypothetical protein